MHESETSLGLYPDQKSFLYAPGTLVRITQQIPRRLDTYTTTVTGTVVKQDRQNSGSWYARNKSNRVWLDRLMIKKADGEITILNLDEYSLVEVLQGPAATQGEAPLTQPSQDASASIT